MSVEVNNEEVAKDETRKYNSYRPFLSQLVATTVKNLLLFDMGMCGAFPGVIIAALKTETQNEHNINEALTLNAFEASWLASIAFICEPIGSLLSAMITDPLGRKRAMMIVNIPLLVAWFLMYQATSVWQIFVASCLMGLGVGLMESPIITYVGEICEPSLRGIMVAYTNVCGSFGMFLVLLLNTLMPWRLVALLCMLVPILTVFALCFIPETPLWLLSKNRTDDAAKALCWLRGWVSIEKISVEFQGLQRYSRQQSKCNACFKMDQKCTHQPTMVEKLKELKRKKTLKPFFIVMSLFIFAEFSGITSMAPFMVQIFKAYGSPIEANQAAAIQGFVNNMANITFLCLIRFTGKRKLYLPMLTIVFLCSATVAAYGFAFLPSGYNSFHSTEVVPANANLIYLPFICIYIWSFCSYCGVNSLCWQMLSEVYPFKARGAAAGLSAALDYLITFISTKTYYNFETTFSLPGVALFYCIITLCGIVLMYKIMPETENRTLEDIEFHFSDNSKKLTDRKIAKIAFSEPKDDQSKKYEIGNNENGLENESGTQNGCDNRGFVSDF